MQLLKALSGEEPLGLHPHKVILGPHVGNIALTGGERGEHAVPRVHPGSLLRDVIDEEYPPITSHLHRPARR